MSMDVNKFLHDINMVDLAERAGAKFGRTNGHTLRSRCPIHGGDNDTAFAIIDDREDDIQRWHCFTRCQRGGDAISFVQLWKGLEFLAAVHWLAETYRLDLTRYGWSEKNAEETRKARARVDVLTEAVTYYQALLWGPIGNQALEYIHSRGFTDDVIKQAKWGYSPSDIGLLKWFQERKIDLQPARDCGLIRADGSDFTANGNGRVAAPNGWIIYPHITGDRCLFFSSRAVEMGGVERPDPKDKSRNLPGQRYLYRADVKGQNNQVVIVEGPADAESLRQLGFSSWALCGLGEKMPETDLAALKRRQVVYLSVDADEAGQQALDTGKISKLATELGPLTMILPGMDSKDFNAILPTAKSETIHSMIGRATTWLETRLRMAAVCPPAETDQRMTEIGMLLSAVPDASKPRYFQLTTKILGITRKEINELIAQSVGRYDGKVLSSIREGCLTFLGKTLCNFQAHITNELIMDDGQNQPSVRYTITGEMANGDKLDTINIDAGEFADMRWVPGHWGARPVVFVSRGQLHEVARAVQEVSIPDMVRERVYTYTGWSMIEGERSYLSATGRITQHGLDTSTRVDLGQNNLRHYALPEPPRGEAMYQAINASLDFLDIGPRRVTAILWASMMAAPLTEIMPLMATLWVYGTTQSGKSTISHLALTHFGSGFISGRQYHAPAEWYSTATSLEGDLFTVKDAAMLIDDFAPQFASATDAREMHKRAHYIIRSVGNRSSRGRARADLTAQTTRVPRGLVMATAENPLVGQSTVGRMIYVPVERGDILPIGGGQNELLNASQERAQNGQYAQAMAAYIQWLAAHWDEAASDFKSIMDIASAGVRKDYPSLQNRLPDYYGLLHAAQVIALQAFEDLGAISMSEMDRQLTLNREAILAVIAEQAEKVAQESPVRKFFQALANLMEQKKIYLEPHTQDVEYVPPDRSQFVGWYDTRREGIVYIKTDLALAFAKEYWRGLDENLDTMSDALRRQVMQCPGLLAKTDPRQAEVSVWIKGHSTRVLAIDAKKVLDLFGFSVGKFSEKEPTQEELAF